MQLPASLWDVFLSDFSRQVVPEPFLFIADDGRAHFNIVHIVVREADFNGRQLWGNPLRPVFAKWGLLSSLNQLIIAS